MNPEIKAKWLEALRSGKYPKTRGCLKRLVPIPFILPAGYCSLGVLCDISGLGKWESLGDFAEYHVPAANGTDYYSSDTYLPDPVAEWAGLNAPSLASRQVDLAPLANTNDRNDTFEPVIQFIEKNL